MAKYCRLICIIAAGLSAFLAGCGGKSADQPKGGETTVLTFWHIQTNARTKAVLNDAVKRFETANPNVEIKAVAYENDAFKTKLKTAFGAGSPPDIFHTWGGGVLRERARAGLVHDLSGLYADDAFKGRFSAGALSFAYIDGKPLMVPSDLSLVLFFYNKELFAQHNLEIPRTRKDLLAVCARLRQAGVVPITLGNKDKWPGCFYYVYGVVRGGGSKPIAAAADLEPGAFKHRAFIAGGDTVLAFAGNDCFNPGFQGINYQASRKLLFTERAGMTLMGTWLIANANAEAPPGFVEKLGCFAFPGEENNGVVGGINCAFAVSAKCPHPDLAEEFLKYLSDATFAAGWARTGRIPACKGAADADFLPLTKEAFDVLNEAEFVQLYFDQLFPPAVGEKHKETCQALFSQQMTPSEVANALAAAAAKARKQP